jgi:hypothetical protein
MVSICVSAEMITQSITREPPMTAIEGLLEAVFSVGSTLRLYSEDLRPAETLIQNRKCKRPKLGGGQAYDRSSD